MLQALNVRWCAGAVERYEARQAAHFCMLKGPIEPTGHADPRQACYAHTCSHVFDPCFLGSAGGLHASGPGLVAAIQAVVLVAAARGVDVRSSRLRRGVGGAARAPGALRQAAPLPTSPMALAVCKPANPRPNPNPNWVAPLPTKPNPRPNPDNLTPYPSSPKCPNQAAPLPARLSQRAPHTLARCRLSIVLCCARAAARVRGACGPAGAGRVRGAKGAGAAAPAGGHLRAELAQYADEHPALAVRVRLENQHQHRPHG